jgi:hypothetical protein
MLLFSLVGLTFLLAPALGAGEASRALFSAGLAIALFAGALGLSAVLMFARAERHEGDAGYTTVPRAHFERWQLDPTTGEVLRRPGEREARRHGDTR